MSSVLPWYNDLSQEVLVHIFSNSKTTDIIQNIRRISPSWRRAAHTVYKDRDLASAWDRVMAASYGDVIDSPLFKEAADKLEKLLCKGEKTDFFRCLSQWEPDVQIKTVRHIIRSVSPENRHLVDDQFKEFILNLFKHPDMSQTGKFAISYYCIQLEYPIELPWEKREVFGTSNKRSFRLESVSLEEAKNLYIHPENTFSDNEEVAVIHRKNQELFYGVIAGRSGLSWKVALITEGGSHRNLILLKTEQIAKIIR